MIVRQPSLMNKEPALEGIRKDINLMHGLLVLIASISGMWTIDFGQMSQTIFKLLFAVYGVMFIAGALVLLLNKRWMILLSCFMLFGAVYTASFYVTNSYIFEMGAFILYIDLIMIVLIFYGPRVGFYAMLLVLSLLVVWLSAIQFSWIHPQIVEPNVESISFFNSIVTAYFVIIVARFRHVVNRNIYELNHSQVSLQKSSRVQGEINEKLKNKLIQVSAVHDQHISRIEEYLSDIKYCISSGFQLKHLENQLRYFMELVDAEIKKINVIFKDIDAKSMHESFDDKNDAFQTMAVADKLVYLMVFLYTVWIMLMNFNELGLFNILLLGNAGYAFISYSNSSVKSMNISWFLVLNLVIVFLGSMLFRDKFNGTPVIDAAMIFFAVCFVYTYGSRVSWPILLLLTISPIVKFQLFKWYGIQSPIVITRTGFGLFLNLIPLMVGVYFISRHFYNHSRKILVQKMEVISHSQLMMQKVNQQNHRLQKLIEEVRSLSDFNAHHLRAPIARSNAIMSLLADFNGNEKQFKDETGYDFHHLIEASIEELEQNFVQFDTKLKEIRAIK